MSVSICRQRLQPSCLDFYFFRGKLLCVCDDSIELRNCNRRSNVLYLRRCTSANASGLAETKRKWNHELPPAMGTSSDAIVVRVWAQFRSAMPNRLSVGRPGLRGRMRCQRYYERWRNVDRRHAICIKIRGAKPCDRSLFVRPTRKVSKSRDRQLRPVRHRFRPFFRSFANDRTPIIRAARRNFNHFRPMENQFRFAHARCPKGAELSGRYLTSVRWANCVAR